MGSRGHSRRGSQDDPGAFPPGQYYSGPPGAPPVQPHPYEQTPQALGYHQSPAFSGFDPAYPHVAGPGPPGARGARQYPPSPLALNPVTFGAASGADDARLRTFLPATGTPMHETYMPQSAAGLYDLPPVGGEGYPPHPPGATALGLQAAPGGEQRVKKTRVRPIVSCLQCRQRRSKCNRVYPCFECERRGEAMACNFAGSAVAPTPASPMRNDPELQAYVARLEGKIRELQHRLDSHGGASSTDLTSGNTSSSSGSSQQRTKQQRVLSAKSSFTPADASRRSSLSSSPLPSPAIGKIGSVGMEPTDYLVAGIGSSASDLTIAAFRSPRVITEPVDVAGMDLAGQLSEMAAGARGRDGRLGQDTGGRTHPLLAELTTEVDLRRRSSGGDVAGDPFALEAAAARPDLAQLVPNAAQARACLAAFAVWINCWHGVVDLNAFEAELAAFHGLPSIDRVDLRWLAVYFGVCALGAEVVTEASAAEVGLPAGRARAAVASQWRKASFWALDQAGAFASPNLETLRALCLLLYHRSPESPQSTFWALSAAVAMASRLGVWREVSTASLERERDARRALAWCLADCDWVTGCLFGKAWHLLDSEFVETALPGDPAGTNFRVPPTLSRHPADPLLECIRVRCVLARLASRLSREILSMDPADHADFISTEQDMQAVESQLPDDLQNVIAGSSLRPWPSSPSEVTLSGLGTVMRLCYLRVRLHQVFVSPRPPSPFPSSVDRKHHQSQLVRYGRVLLNIHRSGVFDLSWTEPLLITVSAAIALAVMLATDPQPFEGSDVRAQVADFANYLRSQLATSSVAQRSYQILERLLSQEAPLVAPLVAESLQRSLSDRSIPRGATTDPIPRYSVAGMASSPSTHPRPIGDLGPPRPGMPGRTHSLPLSSGRLPYEADARQIPEQHYSTHPQPAGMVGTAFGAQVSPTYQQSFEWSVPAAGGDGQTPKSNRRGFLSQAPPSH